MKKICITHGKKNNYKIMTALAEGSNSEIYTYDTKKKHTLKPYIRDDDSLLMFRSRARWANKIVRNFQKKNKPFVYIDTGFFYPGAKLYHRVSVNDFQSYTILKRPDDRWKYFNQNGMDLRPWNKNGRDILICPPTTKTMHGFHPEKSIVQMPEIVENWTNETIELLKKYTDRNIILRTKPGVKQRRLHNDTLNEFLNKNSIHAVISLSGCVAPECIIKGIPAFVHPTNSAAPVSETDFTKIETPLYPDREEWLYSLSYDMWRAEEMKSGEAWKSGILPRLKQIYDLDLS